MIDAAIIRAARLGARSCGFHGWRAAECESAALEGVVRYQCESPRDAYRRGRFAAIDEMRHLTGRWKTGAHEVGWLVDADGEPVEYGDPARPETVDLDGRRRIVDWAKHRPPRVRQVVALMLDGMTAREAAAELHITESAVSHMWPARNRG